MLKVTVLNINEGMNEQLKEKCPDLKQYLQYVDRSESITWSCRLKILLDNNQIDDLKRAAEDEEYLVSLCEEYSI